MHKYCKLGQGTYSFSRGGELVYDSKRRRMFSGLGIDTFRVRAPPLTPSDGGCAGYITVKAKGNRHADELSLRIIDGKGN